MSTSAQTEHALYMFTRTFSQYKHESFISLKTFSDGFPFAHILSSLQYFTGIIDELQDNAQKWTQKLANLKKITTKMESFIENECQKMLKINDVQLVEIAKNNSQQQIIKFFEAVIAVLMQTPQKQDYIQKIMSLDQRSQQALVLVVQNAMDQRISELQNKNKPIEPYQHLTILQNQNYILTQEINQLCKQNENLIKLNSDLQQKLNQCEEQIQKSRNLTREIYMNNSNKSSEIQRENSIIQTLKKKMIEMTRSHQIQITKLNDQIYHHKNKISHYKQIQDDLIQRNRLQEEKLKNFTIAVEDQRRRLQKIIDEKQIKAKKLQYELQIAKNKIRELSEDIEVNDLNLRMELERKQVRFKQLEKQVKSRLNEPSLQLSSKKINNEEPIREYKTEQKEEQLEYLKVEVQKLRGMNRELERENLKLKKKSEKILSIENEKKKLQKIILDVSKCRDSQIQMLVVSLYDLRNQNIKMHQIIKDLRYRQQSKYQ